MLIYSQKLNPKLFDSDVEQVPIRDGFGEGLVKAAEMNKNVVGLCADLVESTRMEAFKKKFPERFIEIGVAEQNLVTVASGMASMGKIPFISSYAVFSPGRNWEQIRTTVCYNNRPVKIVGSHAGVSVGPDGGSHQALEDIAITRVLPRMVVISPCDAIEARKATMTAAKTSDPTYIRLAREKTPIITTEDTPFEIGKAAIVFRSAVVTPAKAGVQGKTTNNNHIDPSRSLPLATNRGWDDKRHRNDKTRDNDNNFDVGIIATGALLFKVLKVAKKLEEEGKHVIVMNLATIKPLDEDAIIKLAHETRALVTVEEHQIKGGMGSAVAECLAGHFPVPIEFIGVKDQFGQTGKPDELLEHYGMGEDHIYAAVQRVMLRK